MSLAKSEPKSNVEQEKTLTQKWGATVMKTGYTVVPSIILRAQRRLHLDSTQMLVMLHLLEFWWRPGDMPYPSKNKIAHRMGMTAKTVQRAMVALEEEGLIKRRPHYHPHGGRTTNRYDLSPLVARLKKIAKEISEADEEAHKVKAKALKPGLKTKQKK